MLHHDDWRAWRARGAWLPVAWALAAALFAGAYAGGRAAWPALLASPLARHDVALTLAVLQSANVGQELLWNAVMFCVMWARLPALERYRVNAGEWAWFSTSAGDAPKRARAWRLAASSVWRALVVNNLLVGSPLIASARYTLRELGIDALQADLASFPSAATVLWQLAACLVMEDFMFYWSHRTLHENRWLYVNVHKIHHQYNHDGTAVSASEHAHPIEFILGNLLPVITPLLLLRAHLFTAAIFTLVRVFVSAEEHCGYAFPWSPVRLLPIQACVEGHDYHHTHNTGVFASQFVWWDRMYGTDRAFLLWRKQRLDAGERRGLKSL